MPPRVLPALGGVGRGRDIPATQNQYACILRNVMNLTLEYLALKLGVDNLKIPRGDER